MSKYAMIIFGEKYALKEELEFVYRVLRDDCGYLNENIQVLYSLENAAFYHKKAIEVTKPDKTLIMSLLESYRHLCENDQIVFVISNYQSRDDFFFDELKVALRMIPCRKILILEEGYDGKKFAANIKNCCVVSANIVGIPKGKKENGIKYGNLIHYFFSYIHESYPNGGSLMNTVGGNNIMGAFQYAFDYNPNNPNRKLKDEQVNVPGKEGIEIPQIISNIKDFDWKL